MKKLSFILILYALVQCAWAQKKEWPSPFVGHSTTKVLTLDKVEFGKGKTVLHVTATATRGASISVSPDAHLSADGKRYAIQKVSVLGIGKQYIMPDSEKVHFTMQFNPLPSDTRLMHFSEGEVDGGWTLCNIMEHQEDLVTEVPEGWKNVIYTDREVLPESKFSDDSTFIRIKILNYVPEAGRKIEVAFYFVDFDICEHHREYHITDDGSAVIGLHPCFPSTIYMRLGKGTYSPILIVPGKEVHVLMDLGKGGNEAMSAFKGELAKTNYELNVQGAKNFLTFDKSDAYFETLINSKKNVSSELIWNLVLGIDRVKDTNYSPSTKEWMTMNAEYDYADCLFHYNIYIDKKIKEELEKANSSILRNSYLWTEVRKSIGIDYDESRPYSFIYSNKMTFCPYYPLAWTFTNRMFKDADGNENIYNKDIHEFFWAINYNETISYAEGARRAEGIQDIELKAFYFIATQRWQEYVELMNRTPHIHYDQHGESRGEELKNNILEEYQGKDIVFLVYDREKSAKDLDELESLVAKADDQKVVFIHIDTHLVPLAGARNWYEAACTRFGEHYGGNKTRYETMFPKCRPHQPECYYELYAPDGTCTLQTTDKKEAFTAIGKLVKQ